MSANKYCCCRLLSCFACFSDKKTAKPDSFEIAPSSQPTVTSFASPTSSQTIVSPLAHPAHDKGFQVGSSSNPSPSSVLTVESSRAISSSAIAASTPNASHDILGHDSQPSSPSAASSSQANASKDENNSQSIAPSAVPASSQPTVTSVASPTPSHTIASPPAHPAHDKRIQVGSSSAPSSSSVPKDSDHTTNIREADDAVDTENVDVDLSELINYISELLDFIKKENTHKEKKEKKPLKPKAVKDLWRSKELKNFREMISEGYNVVKDVCPDVKTIAQGFLKGMGAAHIFSTGLLVVANILERHEAISTNKEACLSILGEMNILTQHVKKLLERPPCPIKMNAEFLCHLYRGSLLVPLK